MSNIWIVKGCRWDLFLIFLFLAIEDGKIVSISVHLCVRACVCVCLCVCVCVERGREREGERGRDGGMERGREGKRERGREGEKEKEGTKEREGRERERGKDGLERGRNYCYQTSYYIISEKLFNTRFHTSFRTMKV